MSTTKKGLLFERPESVNGHGPALECNWITENKLVIAGGGSVKMKGIIRGSGWVEGPAVYEVEAPNMAMIADALVLPEWIYSVSLEGESA